MHDRLQKLLAEVPGVSAWKVQEQGVEARELFYIRRRLDMQRSKEVRRTVLTVYHDFQERGTRYRGFVTVQIHPTHTDDEIRLQVERSVASARYLRNEPFPLVKPGGEAIPLPAGSFAARGLEEWPGLLSEALFERDTAEEARINSAELFLDRVDTRIFNSLGLDVSWLSYRGYIELIVESEGPAGAVELYEELPFSDFEPEALSREVGRQLSLCRDRARARPCPRLKRCPVLITGEPVPEFFDYYLVQSSAESVYSGLSTARVGDAVQGGNAGGDLLTVILEPYLKNSTASTPYDGDGFPLKSAHIIERGVLKRYWGPLRFCHYLDVSPTGRIGNLTVSPGSRSAAELRRGRCLEVVQFSDFRTDALTGDFGGEFRLAYYHDGSGEKVPVTGGSLSGNIRDIHSRMYLSAELQTRSGFQGPQTVWLPEVGVAGSGTGTT
jgi:predicted Zn-dependent protease